MQVPHTQGVKRGLCQGWCWGLPGGNEGCDLGLTFTRAPGTATAPSWRRAPPSQIWQTPLSPACPALPRHLVAVGALPVPCWLFLCCARASCDTLWGCLG